MCAFQLFKLTMYLPVVTTAICTLQRICLLRFVFEITIFKFYFLSSGQLHFLALTLYGMTNDISKKDWSQLSFIANYLIYHVSLMLHRIPAEENKWFMTLQTELSVDSNAVISSYSFWTTRPYPISQILLAVRVNTEVQMWLALIFVSTDKLFFLIHRHIQKQDSNKSFVSITIDFTLETTWMC